MRIETPSAPRATETMSSSPSTVTQKHVSADTSNRSVLGALDTALAAMHSGWMAMPVVQFVVTEALSDLE